MKKTDGRHYNVKSNRHLSSEMNLWCAFSGKEFLTDKGNSKIVDIEFDQHRRFGWLTLIFENGEIFCTQTKFGKPLNIPPKAEGKQ